MQEGELALALLAPGIGGGKTTGCMGRNLAFLPKGFCCSTQDYGLDASSSSGSVSQSALPA
jgi:hypothetical protein